MANKISHILKSQSEETHRKHEETWQWAEYITMPNENHDNLSQ